MKQIVRALPLSAAIILGVAPFTEPVAAVPAPAAACTAAPAHAFDFWIGTWTARDAHGKLLGTNRISKEYGGCVVVERWSGASGVSGTSINTYDAQSERWHETWEDSTGGLLVLDGRASATGMELDGTMPDRAHGSTRNRMVWTRLAHGAVRQHWMLSSDGGRTWNDAFDAIETRAHDVDTRPVVSHELPASKNGTHVDVVDVTYAPGASSMPHAHSCPAIVTVVEGAVRERIGAGPIRTYAAGSGFFEPANSLHAVSANASANVPARFIATFLCDGIAGATTREVQ